MGESPNYVLGENSEILKFRIRKKVCLRMSDGTEAEAAAEAEAQAATATATAAEAEAEAAAEAEAEAAISHQQVETADVDTTEADTATERADTQVLGPAASAEDLDASACVDAKDHPAAEGAAAEVEGLPPIAGEAETALLVEASPSALIPKVVELRAGVNVPRSVLIVLDKMLKEGNRRFLTGASHSSQHHTASVSGCLALKSE